MNFRILSAFFVILTVVSAVTTPRKNCVLNSNGIESCTDAYLPATLPVRQSAPCEKMDMKCWCMKAKEYTNDVRRRRGMSKMLDVGPMKQLDNAVRYAGVLGDMGFLEHQDLSTATTEVGCGRFIGGENIAYNYESEDVAKACVDQWEGSPGHLENILRDRFEEVVIGFHYEADGRVYCVQTFAQKSSFGTTGSESGARCEPVSSDSEPAPTGPAPTTMPPTTETPSTMAPETTTTPSTMAPETTTTPSTMAPTTMAPPTEPDSTRPMPTGKPMMSDEMKSQGNRSCRCLELGSKCWFSLKSLSGDRCMPFTAADSQPMMCKAMCCAYCKYYPNTPPCRNRRVKSTCNIMM